jgi:hypothetical protein
VQAPADGGRDAWYFMYIASPKQKKFTKAVQSGPTNLTDYGEIIESGWGKYPPKEVMEKMEREYGFRPSNGFAASE